MYLRFFRHQHFLPHKSVPFPELFEAALYKHIICFQPKGCTLMLVEVYLLLRKRFDGPSLYSMLLWLFNMKLLKYTLCIRLYTSGSLADVALGVICTSSCAWRECYSKAWLWNVLFKHYRPTHTLYHTSFSCWLKTQELHLKWSLTLFDSNVCV